MSLEREDELLAALWEIRMEAERATTDEPPWALPNRIVHMALSAIGRDRSRAQKAAAAGRPFARDSSSTSTETE